MSLIRHQLFPRSLFNMDDWFRTPTMPVSSIVAPMWSSMTPTLNTMDLFDPFDELDNLMSRNLEWINRPEFMSTIPLMPRVPQKYRVSVNCSGFSPGSVKTQIKENNKLVVTAREETPKDVEGDFSIREFKKTYQLPVEAECDKLVSFMTGQDNLVIEVPLKETAKSLDSDLFPKIVENMDGTKSVNMKFVLPENVDPSKVNVSIKDRDLIFRVEDKKDTQDMHTRFHYYKRTTLPDNTLLDELKCVQDTDGSIVATAPLNLDFSAKYRTVPIDHKSHKIPVTLGQEQRKIET